MLLTILVCFNTDVGFAFAHLCSDQNSQNICRSRPVNISLRMLLTISLWCVYFFILVCYNDKFGIGLMVAELERHKTNMNTKEKHIIQSILKMVKRCIRCEKQCTKFFFKGWRNCLCQDIFEVRKRNHGRRVGRCGHLRCMQNIYLQSCFSAREGQVAGVQPGPAWHLGCCTGSL